MSQWYYSDAQRNRHGPVPTDAMAELHAAGALSADTLVWRDGLANWQPWRELSGEVVAAPATSAVSPATASADPTVHDAPAQPYASAEPRSPYAPPTASLAAADDHVAGGDVVYAGFWKRFAALAIDSLVVGIAYYAVLIAAVLVLGIGLAGFTGGDPGAAGAGVMGLLALVYLIYPVMSALYYVGFESSSRQATLGKMAVGIKVTGDGGRRLSRGQALARWASHLLCYVTVYIGYLMAAFTDRKRGLHDMVAGTLVVDQWAYTAHPERQRRELGAVTVVVIVLAAMAVLAYVAILVAIAIPAYQTYVQRAAGGG